MSIIHPRYKATSGDVMDADKVSSTLADFANEIDGNLGEQNFDEGGFTSRTDDLETDAVLRIDHYAVAVDWTTLNAGNEPVAAPSGSLRVPMNLYWSPLITRTLTTCRGGTYRIVTSFQLDAGETSTAATYWDELAGCTFAFRIDGTLMEDTNQGGAERSNDPKGEGVDWKVGRYTFMIAVPLDPGPHTFELMARPARSSGDVASFSSTSYFEVFSHEFAVIEAI